MTITAYDVTVRRLGYGGGDLKLRVLAYNEDMAKDRATDQARRSMLPPRRRRWAVFTVVACEVATDHRFTHHPAPFAKTDRGRDRRQERRFVREQDALGFPTPELRNFISRNPDAFDPV
ncbi:hypothetical protein [Bradyrhizobium sp. Tv2a-2]|uniref:hypothetical protein n=1 Tax=Bradyrhizobium sp. Tv2a-2 TaxID=113395 RepID=UPI00042889E7|nr:hypothetical protein [Bradyrhizobium sp. Tv2a-2]